MRGVKIIEGELVAAPGVCFGVVASRFNDLVVDRLLEGCVDTLCRHGAAAEAITVVRVPGAWEIPMAARQMAASGRYQAVIGLGAVIRGATAHFDYVAGEAASGLAAVSRDTGVPAVFGVLTVDSIEQALERAGTKAGNKGADAALTALEMASLLAKLRA